jgi:hypothetical protein
VFVVHLDGLSILIRLRLRTQFELGSFIFMHAPPW